MPPVEPPVYAAAIVPALHAIQEAHGYLKLAELKRLSQRTSIPLHRLHEVASFYPHFRLTAPPRLTIRVCRDMACRMAGSSEILKALQSRPDPDVAVEGVSCLGRCDRAPAACVRLVPVSEDSGQLDSDAGNPDGLGRLVS